MRLLILLATAIIAVAAVPRPRESSRIVGGSLTTIEEYPFAVALLYSSSGTTFSQACGGCILNNRSILTAANCVHQQLTFQWRSRIGSSYASSGGTVLQTFSFIFHPEYNHYIEDYDTAIIRTPTAIPTSNVAQPAPIAGANYILPDNQAVWAIGWGAESQGGPTSEQLRHVQLLTIGHSTCQSRYSAYNQDLTTRMLCAGLLDVGGRGPCDGDTGSPLLHNGVVVGIRSWGFGCARDFFPDVNTRVTMVSDWIVANA